MRLWIAALVLLLALGLSFAGAEAKKFKYASG